MVVFKGDTTYCHNILKTVNNLRRENILCDVRILAGRQEIHAHHCVLVAGSEFFRLSLLGENSDERETVVDLSSVAMDAKIVEAIVNFLYLGEISIDMENLDSIVKVASFLSISDVKNFCCTFMLHTLNVNSCLKYYSIARVFSFPEVENKAVSVVMSRFHDAIIFQDIAQIIPPEELQNLLKRCDIFKYCSVADILEYITNWVSLGGTEKHGKTGCDILEYINSKIIGKEEVKEAYYLSMKLQSENDGSEFAMKFKEVICILESHQLEKEAEDGLCTIPLKVEPEDIDDMPSDTEAQYPKEDENHMETSHLNCTDNEERATSFLDRGEMKTEAETSVNTSAKEELYLSIAENSSKAVNFKNESKKKLCNLCGRQFNHLSNLIKHRTTHSTDRPYSCKICATNFKRKETLKKHLLRHSGKNLHACSVCQKRFNTKDLLTSHMTVHSGIQSHVCNVCGSEFARKRSLIKHIKMHYKEKNEPKKECNFEQETEPCKNDSVLLETTINKEKKSLTQYETEPKEKQYSCFVCKKHFNCKQGLTQHMVCHTGEKAYKCEICSKAFAHRAYMISHMKAHVGYRYICNQCGTTFNYLSNLHKHKATHSTDRPLHECDVCGKRYTTKEILKKHMLVHSGEKPYSCSLCLKRFTYNDGLKKHMLFHSGEKRHICSICDHAFAQLCHLNAHMFTHSSEKTHPCELCQKMFKAKRDLKKHMESHSLEKSFICETCGAQFKFRRSLKEHINSVHMRLVSYSCKICAQTFRWKSSLSAHLKTHTEERNHICSTCGKQFRRETQLKRHINIHTREKTHCCDECGRQFYDQGALRRHSYIHSGEKRFICTLCGKHFTRQENLRGHMKRIHPST